LVSRGSRDTDERSGSTACAAGAPAKDDSERLLQGPSEEDIRERFRQSYLARTGSLPSPEEENDAVGFVDRTTTFSNQPLLNEIATKIQSSIPAVAQQEERLNSP
jgi:hypothetical protein